MNIIKRLIRHIQRLLEQRRLGKLMGTKVELVYHDDEFDDFDAFLDDVTDRYEAKFGQRELLPEHYPTDEDRSDQIDYKAPPWEILE
jgi:hypothetical protein